VKGRMTKKGYKVSIYLLFIAVILPMIFFASAPCCPPTTEAAAANSIYALGYGSNFNTDIPGLYKLENLPEADRQNEVEITAQLFYHKGQVSMYLPAGEEIAIKSTTELLVGTTIRTGSTGMAEIRWPDGSTILIAENTELTIHEARGIVLKKDSQIALCSVQLLLAAVSNNPEPSSSIDLSYLRLELARGTIYGSLVSLKGDISSGAQYPEDSYFESLIRDNPGDRVRVEVDMPWGVAGIRGTIWMNRVEANLELTSVLTGEVRITANDKEVTVKPGQFTQVNSPESQPIIPADMPVSEQIRWQKGAFWIDQVITSEKLVQQEVLDQVLNASEDQVNFNGQNDKIPGQSGSAPGQSGTAPGLGSTAPGLSDSTPGQNGSAPGLSGTAPGLSDSTPGQSSSAPGQGGSSPGNSDNAPDRN
jgi:hypothetical protein